MHIEIEHMPVDGHFDLWPENRIHIRPDFGGDSVEYDLLERAVVAAAGAAGMSIQIGLRLGFGAKTILDALRDSGQNRLHIAVDPYGNIEYDAADGDEKTRRDYTNHMMHDGLANLHLYALLQGMNFLFFPLEDTEFFARFFDGVPTYNETKRVETQYAFVILDGPHTTGPVLQEFMWFNSRCSAGAVMVFDDITTYDHDFVDRIVRDNGWRVLEKGAGKMSYKKEAAA